jgi:hypothetical protein
MDMQTLRGRLIIGMTIILSVAVCLSWLRSHREPANTMTVPAQAMYVFQGVTGPSGVTAVQSPRPTTWNQSAQGTRTRLAVLLTDPSSAWLGLVHGLKTIGIPFVITQDYAEALTHHVVLVYPEISGAVLTPEALQALAAFPRSGGTLIGSQVLGGGLQEIFGFREAVPSRQRFEIRFDLNAPIASSLADPRERILRLGDRNKNPDAFGSYGYTQSAGPLAIYEDGTAAVTYKSHGKGQAYAVGVDLGALLLKGYNNRGE